MSDDDFNNPATCQASHLPDSDSQSHSQGQPIPGHSESQPPCPKRSKHHSGSVESEMIKCIQAIKEKRTTPGKHETEEYYFGKHVAEVMMRLPNRAKATARLEIEKILLNAEFPDSQS